MTTQQMLDDDDRDLLDGFLKAHIPPEDLLEPGPEEVLLHIVEQILAKHNGQIQAHLEDLTERIVNLEDVVHRRTDGEGR